MDTKFKSGDIVYALEERSLKLRVKRYVDKIYFCEEESETGTGLRAYFERELTGESLPKTNQDA